MSGRRRSWWPIKLALAAAILVYLFRTVSLSGVVSAVTGARWPLLALAVPFVLLNPVLSAARLKILTDVQEMSLSLRQVIGVNLVSRFYGLALPGHLGAGAVRWYRLVKLEDRKMEVLGAILASRVLHLLGLCTLGLAFLVWDRPRGGGVAAVFALLLLLGTVLVGAIVFRGRPLARVLGRFPGASKLRALDATLGRFRRLSRRKAGLAIGFSLVENLSATLALYLLALALGITLPFRTIGWVRAAVQLVTLVPISVSGLGIREGGLVVALEPYGVSGSSAVALGLLVFAATLLVGLIGGLLELRIHASRETGSALESPRPLSPPG